MATKIPANYLVTIYQQDDNLANRPAKAITAWLSEDFEYSTQSNYDAPFANAFTGTGGVALRAAGLNLMFPIMTAQIWCGAEIPEFQLKLEFHAESDPITEIKRPIVDLLKLVTPKIGPGGLLESPGPQLEPSNVVLDLMSANNQNLLAGTSNIAVNMVKDMINWFGERAQAAAKAANTKVKKGVTTSSDKLAQGNSLTNGGTFLFNTSKADNAGTLLSNQVAISIGRYLYFPSVVVTQVSCNISNIIHRTSGIPMHAECNLTFKPMILPVQEDLDKMFMLDDKSFSQGTWNG